MEEFEKIYQSSDELELRFHLSETEILNIFSKFSNPKIINSVCIFDGIHRKESFYDENYVNLKKYEIIEKKIKLKKQLNKHSIVLSSEEPKESFNNKTVNKIIVKKRQRFEKDGWYFDFTYITHIKIFNNLVEQVQKAFKSQGELKFEVEDYLHKDITVRYYKLINEIFQEDNFYAQLHLLFKTPYKSLKQATNNPIILTKKKFKSVNLDDFMVSSKSDGKRCILKYYDSDNFLEILEGKVLTHGCEKASPYFIIDCEKINGKYYCYDLINDEANYMERLKTLKTLQNNNIILKEILPCNEQNIKKIYNNKDHESDGLIFTQIKSSYKEAYIYKWKPAEQITFDFLIIPYIGKIKPFIPEKNKHLYLLFCGCAKNKSQNIKYPNDYKELLVTHGIQQSYHTKNSGKNVSISSSIGRAFYFDCD